MTATSHDRPIESYGRTRFYDAAAARDRTVDELRARHARGVRFIVTDTETGDEVTRLPLA